MKQRFYYSILLVSIACIIPISCSNKVIPGVYRTNFSIYGMFGKTLSLYCDNSMTMRFAGDLMDDKSFGKWTTHKDTLFLIFDTVNYPNSRYKYDQLLLVRGKKLKDVNVLFSKKRYEELLDTIRAAGMDTLKVPSYKELKRLQGKAPANSYGKMKRQYFVRNERFSCKE